MLSERSALATKWFQVAVACTALLMGSLVYVLDRPPDSTVFFSAISLGHQLSGVFGWIGGSLPAFAHTFSLSVLTAVWLGGDKRACFAAGATWIIIDFAFEIGQHPRIAEHLISIIPRWFERLPILEHFDAYFLQGTFDAWDIVSIIAGATVACFITLFSKPGSSHHE